MRRAQSEPDCTISKRLSDAKFVIAILLLLAVLPYLAAGTDRGVRRLFQKSKAYPNPQADPVVVIHTPKEIHPRLDLEILINDPELRPQLDLLVQAYTRLQERPTSSPLSYFQIAGIHGQPYQAWDGVTTLDAELTEAQEPLGGMEPGLHDKFAGYCWHASVLFPTWHRTYTLLMEQEMRHEALKIAGEYNKTVKAKYLDAAVRLRMPYWDWTGDHAGQNGLPSFVIQHEVEVETPSGLKMVRNPLESYTFQGDVAKGNAGIVRGGDDSGKAIGYAPALYGDRTLRHPDLFLQSDIDRLQEDLRSEISAFVRPAWDTMISDPEIGKSWARFSTHRPRHDGLRPDSDARDLEGLHDLVHDVMGGIVFGGSDFGYPGHFSDANVAAYDPMFFMHHSNVDRLLATYQRKNRDSWIVDTNEVHVKNYMVGLHGHNSSSTTPLWPFRKSHTTFWTSDDVREITELGYTYPEFMDELKGQNHLPTPITASSKLESGSLRERPSWDLFSNNKHIARVASFLKGGKGSDLHRSVWCLHSKFRWCRHPPSSTGK